MSTQPTIAELIAAHLAAILIDEASFDADCNAIDELLSQKTGAAEQSAFVAFVAAPCSSADDVQAKLRHLVDGSVGERSTHMECLFDYGDDLLEKFLRSLLVGAADDNLSAAAESSRGSRAPRATRVCACEEAV